MNSANRQRWRDALVGFLAGMVLMGGLGMLGFDVANDGWKTTVENHKKLERTLMDRIELRDKQDTANAGVRTVLVDVSVRPAAAVWVLPGRVVPRTTDGHLGAYFAWLEADGTLGVLYQAERDTAPTVLPATQEIYHHDIGLEIYNSTPSGGTISAAEALRILRGLVGGR